MATRKNPNAKQKKQVQARVKKEFGRIVCEKCGSKPRGVNLEYHHKNMRNYDTRPNNLVLVCPTCHKRLDNKYTKRVHRDVFGNKRVTRVKKKKPKPKIKKQKVGETIIKKLKDSSGKLRSYKVKKLARGKYKRTLVSPKIKVKKRKKRSSGFSWI
jgi:uncharacterized protein YbaR (Trm112 family)